MGNVDPQMKVSIIGCLALATLTFTALSLVSLGVFHITSFVMLQVGSRASNGGSRRFLNHGEGPF